VGGYMRKTKEIEYEVDANGCWNCTSHRKDEGGYPTITRNYKTRKLHRYMYQQEYGGIKNGLFCLHKCDNPACINPKHLYLGTHQDNMNDRSERGRNRIMKGEKHGRAKLDNEKVLKIRALNGVLFHREIAIMFGVSRSLIGLILQRRNWSHI
jgi:hypothetical protein